MPIRVKNIIPSGKLAQKISPKGRPAMVFFEALDGTRIPADTPRALENIAMLNRGSLFLEDLKLTHPDRI